MKRPPPSLPFPSSAAAAAAGGEVAGVDVFWLLERRTAPVSAPDGAAAEEGAAAEGAEAFSWGACWVLGAAPAAFFFKFEWEEREGERREREEEIEGVDMGSS